MKFLYLLKKYLFYIFDRSPSYNSNEDMPLILKKGNSRQLELIPSYIWMYWEDEELPELIQKCISKIRSLNPNKLVYVLNSKNLSEYLPNLYFTSTDLPLANKSDIIRLHLLYEYGGLWLDSSVMLMDNLDWLDKIITNNHYDLVAFYNNNATTINEYPIIESWFLCAPPKNTFIKAWRDELNPLKDIGAKAYFEGIRSRSDFADLKQNLFREEYLLVYLAMQISIRKLNDYSIFLLNAGKSAFMYHDLCGWNSFEIASVLGLKKQPDDLPPLIKLTSHCRGEINWLLQNGFVNRYSIIGKFLNYK